MLLKCSCYFFKHLQSFYEEERKELFENTGVLPSGCIIFLGCANSPYGKKRIKFPGWTESKSLYVHRISLLLRDRTPEGPPEMEASHLCGVKKCIREEHLVWEGSEINDSRRRCHRLGACQPELNHMPPCIFCKYIKAINVFVTTYWMKMIVRGSF